MSLINQMLKDLEERSSSGAPSRTGPLSGVTVSPEATPRKRRGWLWGALVLVLLAGGGSAWIMTSKSTALPETTGGHTSAERTSLPPVPPPAPAAVQAESPIVPEQGPATLETLRFEQHDGQLQVKITFSRISDYRLLRSDQGRELTLELPQGVMAASLPDTAKLPLLQKVASERSGEGMRLVFSFDEACRYDDLSLDEDLAGNARIMQFVVRAEPADPAPVEREPEPKPEPPQPSLPEETATAAVQPETPAETLGKVDRGVTRQEVQRTPRQRAEIYYQDGLDALRQGSVREAEQALRNALVVKPAHVEARQVLLDILGRQNRQKEFKDLLAQGVREAPEHLPYRIRYGRLLIDEGSLSRAREELNREPRPPVSDALELYALLATVFQRQGDYEKAADTYRELVAVRPQQTIWWMGLGIALEGKASPGLAQDAYRQALSRGGLSERLQSYIRQRLAVLENRPDQVPSEDLRQGKESS